ncbi:MAG: hypothetical protein ACOYZ8_04790 [Chloroflexota bacterium]
MTNHRPRFATLCGRLFYDADPSYFPRAEYRGRTLHLCTESCLGAFLADPGPFCKAHRNSEKNEGSIHGKPDIVERR